MGISQSDATAALSDIERATDRSRTLRAYSVMGPILMLWGVIWAVGYGGMGVLPARDWGVLWGCLDTAGFVLTLLSRRRSGAQKGDWRMVLAWAAAAAFIGATYALFRGVSIKSYFVYPGLICGFVYVLLGIWRTQRLAWIGAGLSVASLAGFYFVQPWLAYWMALVGGGGLFLGGYWLRKA